MVTSPNEYRWDFIGLSTDTKPTPATSENVTDGSTYYEVDTSKLYVWCQDDWYEKQDTGGGGGGSTQQIKTLTSADNNYPIDNPTRISLALLPEGIYDHDGSTKVYLGTSTSSKQQMSRGNVAFVVPRKDDTTTSDIYLLRTGYGIAIANGDNSTGGASNIRYLPIEVVDNLTSTSSESALSAKQGKVLNEKINVVALPLTLNEGTGVLTSQQTCGQIKTLINDGKIFIPYVRLADTSLVEGGVVIITPENSGGNMVIYIFDGNSAQFILISLTANTDSDYFTGSLPS